MSIVAKTIAIIAEMDDPEHGSLHIVLSDGNIRDGDLDFCIKYSEEEGDAQAFEVAKLMRQMTKDERKEVYIGMRHGFRREFAIQLMNEK